MRCRYAMPEVATRRNPHCVRHRTVFFFICIGGPVMLAVTSGPKMPTSHSFRKRRRAYARF